MDNFLLLCDWGNSSLRLALYNTTAGKLINEVHSADGIAAIYRNWQKDIANEQRLSRENVFRSVLSTQVNTLAHQTNFDLENIPIVISGMASSSIGITDLPYADIPFKLDGSQAITRQLAAQPGFPHDIVLISGIQGKDEVMRGEETQMVGIWSLMANNSKRPAEGIVIIPGTHSKHIYFKDERLVQFSTFMTGELYQLLATHSILKDSVNVAEHGTLSGNNAAAFTAGVQRSGQTGLLNALFTVRTNRLFKQWSEVANGFYLSGLLIGTELQNLLDKSTCPLILCSEKNLYDFYTRAIEELELARRTYFLPLELSAAAAMTGQRIIFNQLLKATNG